MDEKRITNHYHFADLGLVGYIFIVAVGGVIGILALGVGKGNPWAIAVAAGLGTLSLVLIGSALTLFIIGRAARHEVERSKVERVRDIDNVKENLALLELQSRAQLAQGRAQTEGWKTVNQEVKARRLLEVSDNEPIAGGFVIDESIFDDLEDEVH